MASASSIAPNSAQDHVQQRVENPRVKRLTIAIIVLSLVVISLVAAGLFLATSAPLQLSIWITASCITLSILVCACWRYKILSATTPKKN
ncbi:hypothetical protein [Candidatus Chlamydia corallus]|uniref:hypothetical protein n=1 Tax=Candidatus Chlamydia corallus TaxID=2038470 RepID=UPI000C2F99C6|nr:hypothetical protein [Candidatus Chlamydia corallus]